MKNSLKSVKFFIWLELTLALSFVFSTKNAQYILQQEGRNTFLSPCRWKLAESSPQLPGRGSQKLDRRRKASGPTLWNKGDTAVDKLSKCNEQESFKLYYRRSRVINTQSAIYNNQKNKCSWCSCKISNVTYKTLKSSEGTRESCARSFLARL